MREGELKGQDSAALAERLRQQLSFFGGLALDGERELARWLATRPRKEEQLRALLAELFEAGDALARDPGALRQWRAVVARALKGLQGQ